MRKKVLILLISVFVFINAEEISFKDLVKLSSADLKTNIYVDKDIKDYAVEINIADYQKKGEITSFLNTVLFDNDMYMKYNVNPKYYTIVKRKNKRKVLPLKPEPNDRDKIHYYTYKIKNITNNDVKSVLSIFNIKYKYLAQSDIIAYSCTQDEQQDINKMLTATDNDTKQIKVKISIFNVNKKKLKDIGTKLNKFGISFSSDITNNLLSSNNVAFQNTPTFELDAYMTALESRGISKISQSPTIVLTNGVKATLNSVSNVRYVTGTSQVDNNNNSSIRENYEYRDVGLKISILPKIKDNFVYFDFSLVSEEFISYEKDNPIVGKISFKNSFKVTKHKPLLLTGINKSVITNEKSGIPFLKDLPYIGKIFGSESLKNENQNINILIEVL